MPNTAICLTLRASKRLRGWLLLSHTLPLCFIAYQASLTVTLTFAVLALILFYQAWQQLAMPVFAEHVVALERKGDGWLLRFSSGAQRDAALLTSTGFRRFWLLLVFVDAGGRSYRVPIWSDSTDAEGFRRLRVWLNLQAETGTF